MALHADDWRAREAAHAERADALVADHRDRASRGEKHPVHDFLFTYYPTRAASLRRWHPGAGVRLAEGVERASWRWYRVDGDRSASVDADSFRRDRSADVARALAVLRATASRKTRTGCFGLHEWAMVYRTPPDRLRHAGVPLRLGARGTDDVVESLPLRCSHFDAFRFFTDEASPRNPVQLTRASQVDQEQPGCLHAGMDVYRWALALGPLVPGEVLLDAFALAREIRDLDMAASPYDLSGYGVMPVPIETVEGRATYAAAQRSFADRGQALRTRLLATADSPSHG